MGRLAEMSGARKTLLVAVALTTVPLALSACGKSNNNATPPTTTTTAPAGTTTTAPTGTTTSSGGGTTTTLPTTTAAPTTTSGGNSGSNPTAELNKLTAAAAGESKATFKLTYSTSGSSGAQQITIEQKPPDQLFKSNSGFLLTANNKTYYCSSTGGAATTCIVYGSASQSPVSALIGIYSSGTYITTMKTWQTVLAAHLPGIHISFTSASFAGQPSQCVNWDYSGQSVKYCITDSGVLAYVGSSGKSAGSSSTFELKSYSTSVSSSDFSLPHGAKIQSIPGA